MRRSRKLGVLVAAGALAAGVTIGAVEASSNGESVNSVGWVSGELNTTYGSHADMLDSAGWVSAPAPAPAV